MSLLKTLFSSSYLFTINAVMLTRSDKIFVIVGGCLVVLAVGLKLFSIWSKNPVDKRLLRRVAKFAFTIGVLEVLWFGLRYENVRFLGTHFMALIMYFIGLLWFIVIAKYVFKGYRHDKQSLEKELLKKKYLNN